ncbi:MAG: proton-conducting transporter membrane subunit [Nodosilinea sp.]
MPVYLLISIWGGQKRLYAATKFILYTAIGSIFILVAALAMAFYGDTVTSNLTELAQKDYSLKFQLLVYAAFLVVFAVKLPIFPLHTWLPDAHSESPAAVSMILAGVLLKMAGYGLIRMNIFTAASMGSLALPGMSGFVSEIAVFLGTATSDVYNTAFKTTVFGHA